MSEILSTGLKRVQSPENISSNHRDQEDGDKRQGTLFTAAAPMGSSLSEIEDLEPLPPTLTQADTSSIPINRSRKSRHSVESSGNASSSSILESPTRMSNFVFSSSLPSEDTKPRRTSNTSSNRRSSLQETQSASLSARYVTVSSILSRSGAALPLSPLPGPMGESIPHEADSLDSNHIRKRSGKRRSSKSVNTKSPNIQKPLGPRSSGGSTKSGKQTSTAKRASNGSALEALGALFLQRDSIGKVSNLSFLRYRDSINNSSEGGNRPNDGGQKSISDKFTFGLTSVSRAWLERMSGSSKVGIRMPNENDAGQTIAQRRARKGVLMDNETGSRIESTSKNQPTFEVLIRNPVYPIPPSSVPAYKPPEEDNFKLPPAPRLAGMKGDELTPPPLDQELYDDQDFEQHTFLKSTGPMTEPIRGVYGPGSAFSWLEVPELPPSPVGMPGAWSMGSYGWNKEEGALLLPPPLLDDQGSDAKSFEGLLGIRRMREQERQRKQFEKLKARNRPAHKVGMLTAFSNFVKAAHAADKAARSSSIITNSSSRAPFLKRRHTEPAEKKNITDEEEDEDGFSDVDETKIDVMNAAPLMARTGSQARSSIDSTSRPLDPIYEAKSPDIEDEEDEEDDDDEEEHVRFLAPGMRRTASADDSRIRSRVPIQMAENGMQSMSVDEGILSVSLDQLSQPYTRNGSTGPTTPRIGPTMLSLPPSPWTPYGGGQTIRSGIQTPYQFHLGMTPFIGPPGTPRLIPAMLEVAPSPFPMLGGMTPFLRSPRGSDNINHASATHKSGPPSTNAPSPLALSPSESPILAPYASIGQRLNEENINEHNRGLDLPTPKVSGTSASSKKSVRLDDGADLTEKAKETKPIPSTTGKRSFLLWFLFGDLGLGSRSTIAAKAAGSPTPINSKKYSTFYVIILSITAHLYGFSVFILAHLVDLAYRIAEFISMAFWFLRWMVLNLTGQTVLARCAIDAYGLVAKEWETVAREDHEWKGLKEGEETKEKDPSLRKYRGITKWQVMKGMVELICLQDVTRERYLEEGAGLEELKGWKRKRNENIHRENNRNNSTLPATPSRIDLGLRRAADRKAKDEKEAFDERQREQRLVEEQDPDSENEDEEDDESESESSDDDMVVTRRGVDVLEFTKTPKVEIHHGYFPSSEDGMMEDEQHLKRPNRFSRRSLSGTSRNSTQALTSEPVNRQLVKLIKWASRLSISAYGLHVTLVDLPATFTPSGNRFSRQTFAHLSRLHHEDVLHADIQTLDSDDYSPTFYLVRDLKRKVVVVSVRGTQSLQDIIVDLEMVVDQFKLQEESLDVENEKDKEEILYCHAGILRAARALVAKDSTLFKTLNQALRENPDFGIVFTGHSLGGAIASAVVLLLSKYENNKSNGVQINGNLNGDVFNCHWEENQSNQPEHQGRWVTHDQSGLPAGRPIRAITFAHPATVNAALAERASRGRTPLVLSVVLGHDIIPRCGHGQARELRRVLGALSRVRRRKEHGSSTDSRRGSISDFNKTDVDDDDMDPRVHIFTSWWTWRKLKRKSTTTTLTKDEELKMFKIETELWRLRCDVESDLYSAIKRRTGEARMKGGEENIQEENSKDEQKSIPSHPTIPPSPWIGPSHKAPLHQLAARRQTLDSVTLANEEKISKSAGVLVPAGRSIWVYEGKLFKITSPLGFFSLPDFHPKMFSEHFPSAYEDQLEGL